MTDTANVSQAEIHLAVRLVHNDLALRLAYNDGYLDSPDSWAGAGASMRKCYIDLARETLAVMGGPTDAQKDAAALRAEVRELKHQRDRYRDAWRSACRRVRKGRRS
ncbi:MAG: hypothetical protein HOZ81_20255 [Streptomyces sp.]|nr:hypothetical protein [Streptomyces sp.]NUS81874.1 hypothetical protein [Streptomyces sp.]